MAVDSWLWLFFFVAIGLEKDYLSQYAVCEIVDFDKEVYFYEVEARNDEEAALKAEQMFNSDIYTMYVYLM